LTKGWDRPATVDEVLKEIREVKGEKGQDWLVILNYPLDDQKMQEYSMNKVAEFAGPTIVEYEEYYLYVMK
jgi:hypothetical protein